MLYLVEGLNASGKSTFINRTIEHQSGSYSLSTYGANPLRFDSKKKETIADLNSYLYGYYESLFHSYYAFSRLTDIYYWDRTFISAYVYGSISFPVFEELCKLYCNSTIIFMDTPIEVCKERWNKLTKDNFQYKPYVKYLMWETTLENFESAFIVAKQHSLKLERIKYEQSI